MFTFLEASLQFQKIEFALEHLTQNQDVSYDKETWETCLTSVIRKWIACEYHLENVRAHKDAYSVSLKKQLGGSVTTAGTELDRISYELSAFMAALKSATDYLAELTIRYHLNGVEGDSTRTILRLLKKDTATNQLLATWRISEEWLATSREYRHPLIHRVSPRIRGGGRKEIEGGLEAISIFPILVPDDPFRRQPDTRLSRAFEEPADDLIGMITGHKKIEQMNPDGSSQVLAYELTAEAAPGFTEIEKFMERHLTEFETLISNVLQCLVKQNFEVQT